MDVFGMATKTAKTLDCLSQTLISGEKKFPATKNATKKIGKY